ncbi:MAG: hypothetical protein QNM02_08535 [Acidimicrobiia bacterium]|nr:hypothetical protein [Acidimicrobiia bacterium]
MTVAALQADSLRQSLEHSDVRAAGPRFFNHSRSVLRATWLVSAWADHRFPATSGSGEMLSRLTNPFLDALQAAALTDSNVTVALSEVLALRNEPWSLLRPATVRSAVRSWRSAA